MSDAQYDGGDKGSQAEDTVGGWIGDLDDSQAMYWYGSYTLLTGAASLVVWVYIANEIFLFRDYSAGIALWWIFYLPFGVTWFLSLFIGESESLNGIMKRLVAYSVLGPFWDAWYIWGQYLWGWNDDVKVSYYIVGAAWFVATIIQEIVQILLLPKVFNYIDGGKYDDEGTQDGVVWRFNNAIGF